jgi:hypothetical protein
VFTIELPTEKSSDHAGNGNGKQLVTDDLRPNLKRLVKSLETKYFNDYEHAKQTQTHAFIENFGKELELLGTTMGSDYLSDYGRKIALSAQRNDLEASMLLLDLYPNIVEDIKSLLTE